MALEHSQFYCNLCKQLTLHQRNTKESSHVGCYAILILCVLVSLLLPCISWLITVPIAIILICGLVASELVGTVQPPFRCSQCGQDVGELTDEQRIRLEKQHDIDCQIRTIKRHELWERFENTLVAAFLQIEIIVMSIVRITNKFILKMAGGDENAKWIMGGICLALLFLGGLGIYAVSWTNHQAKQNKINAANLEVHLAVERANRWIKDGRLSEADKIDQELKEAELNSIATEKDPINPALISFHEVKKERQEAEIYETALDAISRKHFDEAKISLENYLKKGLVIKQKEAKELLSEIALVTSDDNAMKTLLSIDDGLFASFMNGDFATISLSQHELSEARIESLKKNIPEAARQREEKHKKAEEARIASDKRLEAEKQAAIDHDEEKQKTNQVKEEEKAISYDVLERRDLDNKFRMDILVSESESRQDVLKLSKRLQSLYKGKYIIIDIFDSREAWRNRENLEYPEREYFLHYLVQIGGEWDDGQEVHWVAEGRDH